jgi:type VI secretion system protein ImpM
MRCGLFGKIQSKRDFIAVATPRTFLSVWEPWIQSAISASRAQLGQDWQRAFLTAPVWRFWLGADICGKAVFGAMMASMDGLGRYFPLTLIAMASDAESLAPPEIDPQDQWFAAAESFLFMTLEEKLGFEDVTQALEVMPSPASAKPCLTTPGSVLLPRGGAVTHATTESFINAFADARVAGHAQTYAATTCWWTAGGEGYDPLVLIALRMPDPYVYADMLTGQFENGAAISRSC